MPEDQRLSLLLQRACRRDFARWRRGAKAPDSLVKGLEGTGGERARPTRAGGETVRQALHAARREAMGNSSKIRVGIVGLSPNRGFASIAHIPALRALPEFEIAAVCTTRQDSAEVAARHFGIPLAFSDPEQLAQHPNVDLVTVTVKVPDHYRPVIAAIEAGKHVYCEWPLGRNTDEALAMLDA